MRRQPRCGFTLVELLISISVISLLTSILLPVLGRARGMARATVCTQNLRQLGHAWQSYADDNLGFCMPQVWSTAQPAIYWWGTYENPPNYEAGLLYPYLDIKAGIDNVFDCPAQPWGTYLPGWTLRYPSTTYGYNGLGLAPFYMRPTGQPVYVGGWPMGTVPNTRWHMIEEIPSPTQVFVFADTLMEWFGGPKSSCLLDGPEVPSWTSGWAKNNYPTLCFRHSGRAAIVFADGHVESLHKSHACITWTHAGTGDVGYIGATNAPHYVPDRDAWY